MGGMEIEKPAIKNKGAVFTPNKSRSRWTEVRKRGDIGESERWPTKLGQGAGGKEGKTAKERGMRDEGRIPRFRH